MDKRVRGWPALAWIWNGTNNHGFHVSEGRLWLPNLTYAKPGDWVVQGPGKLETYTEAEFKRRYEILEG